MTDEELKDRAHFLSEYWTGTVTGEVLEFFLRLNDMKNLAVAVKNADKAMFDSEFNPNE